MNIVFPDGAACLSDPSELDRLRALGEVHYYDTLPESKEELISRLKDSHAAVIDYSKVDSEVMDRCPDLRFLCFLGIGYRAFIDVDAATARGIAVSYTPDYGSTSVAEHTVMLMMALARRLVPADKSIREGRWEPGKYQGIELKDKTLGIVGLGPIGMEVARIASALGMRIVVWTRNPNPERRRFGLEYRCLEALFEEADVVTLHLAHTPETERLISEELLGRLKPGALFINAARTQLVDNAALTRILQEGRICAAFDVYEEEPPPADFSRRLPDSVIFTPHMGFNTREAASNMLRMAVDNVCAFAEGRELNIVKNPTGRP